MQKKVQLISDISDSQMQWRNDPSIYRYTRQNGIISQADMDRWKERIKNDPSIKMFGILTPYEENCGTCGLTSISPVHGTAEFSLLIGPEYQRNGYGKAALIELLKYGFKHLRLHLVFGETFVTNPAFEMFKKLGMKEEGRVRQRYFKDGNYEDAYIVSILKEEAVLQPWWN